MTAQTEHNRPNTIIAITVLQIILWIANIIGYHHYSGLDSLAFSILMTIPFMALGLLNVISVVRYLVMTRENSQKLNKTALGLIGLLLVLILLSPKLAG